MDRDVQPAELDQFLLTHPRIEGADDGTVPPAEGQGDGGTGGLYDLSEIPEEVRPTVEPVFKQFDANVTREFQKRAEALNRWKPYEELGVNNVEPETMGQLLDLYDLMQDENQFKGWLSQAAEQYGLLNGNEPEPESFGEPETDPRIQELEKQIETLKSSLEPIQQQSQQAQQAELERQEGERLQNRLEELAKEHGIELDDEVTEDIYTFALAFEDDPDPMAKAVERWNKRIGQAERNIVEGRRGRPEAPEGPGGRPAVSAEAPKSFAEADKMARERLAQLSQT